MSVWSRIVELASKAFEPEADPPSLSMQCAPDPNDVGFTAAVVGLAAKMARADGSVTRSEMEAARAVFQPPAGEEQAYRRAFDIARQTVLGYESYARQIGRKYRARPCLLEDVLDGLFHIAAADGWVGPDEMAYLARVGELFGFSESEFRRIRATNLGLAADDPYAVLGLLPGAAFEDVRKAWRRLAAEHHPDQMQARGAPPAFVAVAHEKMTTINEAYAQIREEASMKVAAD